MDKLIIDTFDKLQDFINQRKNKQPYLQANFQPVVIRALLQNNSEQFIRAREKEMLTEIAKRIGSEKTKFESSFISQSRDSLENLESIEEILKKEESSNLEFKSTLKWDIRENRANKDRIHDVLKAIAGFMNGNGGTLIVGYDDDNKTVIGLEKDYPFVGKKEWDSWVSALITACKTGLGLTASNLFIKDPIRERYDEKDLARIIIKASDKPVYFDDVFYVRYSGQTSELKGSALDEYKKSRFD